MLLCSNISKQIRQQVEGTCIRVNEMSFFTIKFYVVVCTDNAFMNQESTTRSVILPYWVWPLAQSQKCLFLDFLFLRNKQRVSYLTNHNVRFYYAIFFTFVAVIMVTAFRGKLGSENRHVCYCADGRMYLTITLLVLGSCMNLS